MSAVLPLLPSALKSFEGIRAGIGDAKIAVFLDYDGTLTPIVHRPEDAVLDENMRAILKKISTQCPVAIVSGRDRKDVERRVGLENLYYVGSHGFDMRGPDGVENLHAEGDRYLDLLDAAERTLLAACDDIDGLQIERKKYSIAVHYRRVAADTTGKVERTVDSVLETFDTLKRSGGKKVIEIQPAIDWHKGSAVRSIVASLEHGGEKIVPLYIGDDLTDENAFREIWNDGIGILVAEEPRESYARYLLGGVDDVREFLIRLIGIVSAASRG
jgi:trehalose-phosphatase